LILLMGYGSEEFRHGLVQKKPELGCWLQATGALPPEVLSCHLSACDLMIQPYRDGVSSRRTSVMAALSHGKPVVTTSGHATEALWAESGAVVVAPENDTETFVRHLNRLCSDSSERARLGKAARRLYKDRFDIAWTAAALKGSVNQMPPVCVG
jgi:glycosyltransferase involved in cell wall biosynthesis